MMKFKRVAHPLPKVFLSAFLSSAVLFLCDTASAATVTQPSPPAAVIPTGGPTSSITTEPPIDINQADLATLEKINGLGPKKAQTILEFREKNGPFLSLEQLSEIKGIGPKFLERNKGKLVVNAIPPKLPAKTTP